ncbi:hypothetical protein R3P38DRAFT_2994314 [Favolaschia claudopus]|uniref:Uncharacterized protein n=1 Tax=Favolaschia claudopus TaxID=2862362 RepID=A0AAW0ASR5_9AGAR
MILSELHHQVERDASQVPTIFQHCKQILDFPDDLMQDLALQAATYGLLQSLFAHQVSTLIENKRGRPLTAELLDSYASCLTWTFVSASTKTMILSELRRQVERDESQVSTIFQHCRQIFEAPESLAQDVDLQAAAGNLLRCLHVHQMSALLRSNRASELSLAAEILELYAFWMHVGCI